MKKLDLVAFAEDANGLLAHPNFSFPITICASDQTGAPVKGLLNGNFELQLVSVPPGDPYCKIKIGPGGPTSYGLEGFYALACGRTDSKPWQAGVYVIALRCKTKHGKTTIQGQTFARLELKP